MKGNAPKAAVAHMMRSQQIILHEGNMGAIRNGGLPTAPEKGQLKPGVLCNHIAQGRFQFGGRNMLGIQPAQDLPANRVRRMAGRLRAPNSQA